MNYWEDPGPGYGVLPARAAVRSDAPRLSLNGQWRFRWSPTVPAAGFEAVDFDDSDWDWLPVPSSWPMHGHGSPAYTNQKYPFPVDPPYVPDENPTGDHRLVFSLPSSWSGPSVLRFDGVDSCARVWLNGVELGVTRGSRLPAEFAVGEVLRPGRNVLAVRVHQWSSGSYLEDQDMWWLPGIFRDVTLISRPVDADVFVHADYADGAGVLMVESVPGATVRIPALDVAVPCGETVTIPGVEPWSAEVPRSYDAVVELPGERVSVRIGFRTVEIVDGVLRVNGRRIVFRGVNRHEHDPVFGRAVPYERMREELLVMKRHNLNAIRTSHYPPDSRLLELCDELGFWVMDECDYETHGFFLLDWRGNPADDPRFLDASLDRMRRTVERDKNHPSVVMWSLGNEAGVGSNLTAMAAWTRDRDPSRPLHYEGDLSCADVDVYSRMYASHAEVEAIGKRAEKPLEDPVLDARRRAMPFVLCEYSHAGGNGPGGLPEYEELFDRYERCQGGFLWEWMEHGILRADGSYGYGGDFGEELHDGTYVLDGLVFPDLTPQPVLAEVHKAYEPIRLTIAGELLTITNRYDVLDTAHLSLQWTLADEGEPVDHGTLDLPVIPPGASTTLELPQLPASPNRWLTIRAVLATDTTWAPAGHEVAFTQSHHPAPHPTPHPTPPTPATPAPPESRLRGQPRSLWVVPAGSQGATHKLRGQPLRRDGGIRIGAARFCGGTGRLVGLRGWDVEHVPLELWRAPTQHDARTWDATTLDRKSRWANAGLDRLRYRTVSVDADGDELVVVTMVGAAATDARVLTTYRWTSDGDNLTADVEMEPLGEWTVPWARVGVTFGVPPGFHSMTWFGLGPGQAYPDSRAAARVGRYTSTIDNLQIPYLYPQENGARADVRWAELSGTAGRLRLTGDPHFALTVRRWTIADLAAAEHPADLHPSDNVWITLDALQHGLGSPTSGAPILPPHDLQPKTHRFRFSLGG
ncbi:glycoside hydrolase family 2 TIM barrel-domain containing protein [Kribbella sp. NPDC051586]|uniref:glycoside hydrolase family 2 TIM barrel-domain containing protein n=1 Tax=Kribbella sp. NPDC051586 TaxID=3364118 RepID=UPI00379ED706